MTNLTLEDLARVMCANLDCRFLARQQDAPYFDESEGHVQKYWVTMAKAILDRIQETHRIVPIEPTEEMVKVGDEAAGNLVAHQKRSDKAVSDHVTLSALEAKAITAWADCDDGDGFGFRAAQKRSEVPAHLIRRVVRALARKGMLVYVSALYSDEGQISAGYALTKNGCDYLNDRQT